MFEHRVVFSSLYASENAIAVRGWRGSAWFVYGVMLSVMKVTVAIGGWRRVTSWSAMDEVFRLVNGGGRKRLGSGSSIGCALARASLSLESICGSPHKEWPRQMHAVSALECACVRTCDGLQKFPPLLPAPFISNAGDSWLRWCRWSAALRLRGCHVRSRRRNRASVRCQLAPWWHAASRSGSATSGTP